MTGTAPAGWYDSGDGRQRYWDGARWTESFRPTPVAFGTPPVPGASASASTQAGGYTLNGSSVSASDLYQGSGSGGRAPKEPGEGVPGWVIAAALALGALAVAAVVVFMIAGGGQNRAEPTRTPAPTPTATVTPTETPTAEPVEPGSFPGTELSEPTAEAATVVVQAYDEAFWTLSCDGMTAVSASGLLEERFGTCLRFVQSARDWVASVADYDLTILSAEVDGVTATVSTEEAYTFAGDPAPTVDYGVYTLDYLDGRWVIAGLEYVEGP